MAIGVDDGLVTCKITVTYGDWSADISPGRSGQPFEEQRPGVPLRDEVAEFRVMDTAALYFDFYEGGLAFEERDDESLFCLLTEGLSAPVRAGRGHAQRPPAPDFRSRPAPKLSVRATVKSNLLDVELGASGLRRQTLPSIWTRTSATRRLRALRPATIIRLDEGARATVGLAEDRGGVDAVDLLDGVSLPRRAPFCR